jgi:hypothetical protein
MSNAIDDFDLGTPDNAGKPPGRAPPPRPGRVPTRAGSRTPA